MFIFELFFCPDGIILDSSLTGLNNIYIYIYIYIVIHRQICFVLSELISVARHISFP